MHLHTWLGQKPKTEVSTETNIENGNLTSIGTFSPFQRHPNIHWDKVIIIHYHLCQLLNPTFLFQIKLILQHGSCCSGIKSSHFNAERRGHAEDETRLYWPENFRLPLWCNAQPCVENDRRRMLTWKDHNGFVPVLFWGNFPPSIHRPFPLTEGDLGCPQPIHHSNGLADLMSATSAERHVACDDGAHGWPGVGSRCVCVCVRESVCRGGRGEVAFYLSSCLVGLR